MLTAQGYFDGNDAAEKALRDRIEQLWREVEWSHYTQGQNALYWHWSPDYGFAMNHPIKGYDETFVTYILAAASPTFPIDKKVYDDCWVNRKEGEFFCATDFYGIMLPLGKRAQMGGRCSGCTTRTRDSTRAGWPTGLQTTGNRTCRYTLVDRAYCIDNPYR